MEIKIYNGLTKKKDVFYSIDPNKTTFYSCGPTTYDFLHVGNARALVVGDIIYRTLRSFGHRVIFVRNFTDVDDKIIERAKKLGIDPLEFSAKYVDECQKDMDSLGLLPPTHAPKVSESITDIIQMIEDILQRNHAYIAREEVLFHVPSFPQYGKLSKKDIEGLQHGNRVKTEEHKKHPSDFVLWKPVKEGGPSWDSPWGRGRPGWHIECSAMSCKFLGKHFDLHHGGIDLIFPHHENEIAQSEAANGQTFCNIWVHNEFLHFNKEKMSKSLGNIITIRKFVETYGGAVLRHLLSSVHYRSRLEWSHEAVDRAVNDTDRVHRFVKKVYESQRGTKRGNIEEILSSIEKMKSALADDFHISMAMSVFFPLIRDFNRNFSKDSPDEETLTALKKVISFVRDSTGLVFENYEQVLKSIDFARKQGRRDASLSRDTIENLLEERDKARRQKDWAKGDQIRETLQKKGVSIQDNPDGTTSWFSS